MSFTWGQAGADRAFDAAVALHGSDASIAIIRQHMGSTMSPQTPVVFPLQAVAFERVAMSSSVAPLLTTVDGVRLHLSTNSATGYTGVYERGCTGRYFALWTGGRSGRTLGLGTYGSAREAATAYARHAALTAGERLVCR